MSNFFLTPPPALRPTDEESPCSPTDFETKNVPRRIVLSPPSRLTSLLSSKSDSDYASSRWTGRWTARWTGRWTGVSKICIAAFAMLLVLLSCGYLASYSTLSHSSATCSTDDHLTKAAREAFSTYYPEDWHSPMNPSLTIVLESETASLLDPPSYEHARKFETGLGDLFPMHRVRIESPYSYLEQGLAWLAHSMTTPDGKTFLIKVQYDQREELLTQQQLEQAIVAYGKHFDTAALFRISYMFEKATSKRVAAKIGRLSSYRILFDGHSGNETMDSENSFDIIHTVVDELIAIDQNGDYGITHIATDQHEITHMTDALMDTLQMSTKAHERQRLLKDQNLMSVSAHELALQEKTQYDGIAVLKNTRIPYSLFHGAKLCAHIKPYCPVEAFHLLDYNDQVSTTDDGYATYVTARVVVNNEEWLEAARETIDRLREGGLLGSIQVHIESPPVKGVAAVVAELLLKATSSLQ